jgi:N-methylhydantoinase A
MGLSTEEAAHGIIRIVNENILGALRVVSVQRGIDPRDLVLVPFGGAGPVHGARLAQLLGIETVLVPALPGVLSALGFLLADIKNVLTLTRVSVLDSLDLSSYNRELQRLMGQAHQWLQQEDVPPADRVIAVALDLRYQGQAYELPLAITSHLDSAVVRDVAQRFHVEHKRRYGFDAPFAPIDVVTLRVTAIGKLPKPALDRDEENQPDVIPNVPGAQVDERSVYFDGAHHRTPVYDRLLLQPGNRLSGPAIIVQADCTTVLEPGHSLRIDRFGNLVVRTRSASAIS